MINPILPLIGKELDWEALAKPLDPPIPGQAYSKKHVIYAIRHPNKALPVSMLDCNCFAYPGMKRVRDGWRIVE